MLLNAPAMAFSSLRFTVARIIVLRSLEPAFAPRRCAQTNCTSRRLTSEIFNNTTIARCRCRMNGRELGGCRQGCRCHAEGIEWSERHTEGIYDGRVLQLFWRNGELDHRGWTRGAGGGCNTPGAKETEEFLSDLDNFCRAGGRASIWVAW